jgi:aspartate-semialdehyde dehydrogenase
MPINAKGKDHVFVGRIREDLEQKNTFNLWIVADNLRKGAATNAVQIMELLIERGLVSLS